MGTVAFPVAMLPHIEARNGAQLAEPGDEFDQVASLLADTFARAGFIEGATIKESTLHP
ncbi:MAG TPA: hypothetical protein VFH39_02710 [Candidatus Saccharimonadales bacterium]|nr:hypothetical protein [Candidatus Saccharimonadales bacterium]